MAQLLVMAADAASAGSPGVGTIVFVGTVAVAFLTMAVPLAVGWRARRRAETDENQAQDTD